MCQMVLEICPLCKFCGPLHRPYMKTNHWHEPQGNNVCRRCINLAKEKNKQDDKKKDKDKKAQDKVDKAARMKAWSKSNKAEGKAIKRLG
ncbi:hypothetical protein J4E89_008854 [Alternaria sp. Ai002NY15]|nr:hypothetical protein J4E89_008854 [Alternaria sp. Ai002NY15]